MSLPTSFRFLCVLSFSLFAVSSVNAYNWDEISQEELSSTECSFDPDAAAEVLFKETIYDLDERNVRIIKTHLRTKVYEESALDRARRTKFWYSTYFKTQGINARVVKPDGSYIEVDKDDIVSEMERRSNGNNIRSTTISVPQVEVGDIVEYRYRLILDEGYYLPKDELKFQEQWPIRRLELKMKPYSPTGLGFKWASHRCGKPMTQGKGGFYEITLENQLGYPDEPYQAPEDDAKSWFTFYNVNSRSTGDAFWKNESKRLFREMNSDTKADKVVEEKAAELAKGLKTKEEKLSAFYAYCVNDLVNAAHGKADRLTQEQREDLNDKWSASKVISNGYGTTRNINTVFCALAQTLGFDARVAVCADRSTYSFTKALEDVEIALPHSIVAIKNGKKWNFYNPAAKYIPFGQLDWLHDEVTALIPDKKELILVKTQAASPVENLARFEGNFELSETGDLSGSVVMTALGNSGLMLKQLLDGKTAEDRVDTIKDAMGDYWANSEIENVVAIGADDPFTDLKITCDISIPGYAESVGSRLFLQPNVEERYAEPQFPSTTRKTDIFFDFKYLNETHVEIALPEGFALEAPSAPHPLQVEGFYTYEPKLSFKPTSNTLVYSRRFEFVGNRYLAKAYPAVKAAFDNLLSQDQHVLTLKRSEEDVAASDS